MSRSASLVDDSGNVLLTLDSDSMDGSLVLTSLDLGYPSPREASTVLSGQDGENDVTTYTGGRAITAEVGFVTPSDTIGSLQDTVRGLMHPGRRYWLYVQQDGWSGQRMIRVRGASLAMPTGPLPWVGQLGWKAPGATFQDVTASSVTLSPQAQSSGGMTLPMSFPMSFQPGLVPGASILTVNGTAPAPPVVDMYGPCSDPLFRVVTTGQQVSLPGLSIAAGSFVRVDVAARTVLLNNDPAQSQLNRVDYSSSSWPLLPTGSPEVVFSPSSTGAGCQAVLSWRSQWL